MSWELLQKVTAREGSALPMPRTVLVFAHPDDEVVALGARLGRFKRACFVHVTDGAPRNQRDSQAHGFRELDDYRQAREQELGAALAMAGLWEAPRKRLMIPDQEAALRLAWLTKQIGAIFAGQRPEVVVTHPYEGGHPDHDACAFATRHAANLWRAQGEAAPVLVEAVFYHATLEGVEAGSFAEGAEQTERVEYALTAEERRRKRALLDCFVTQRETVSGFPMEYERFRIAPQYDFGRPPNEGRVLYDRYPWGMTSERFCHLAREAEEELAEVMASRWL